MVGYRKLPFLEASSCSFLSWPSIAPSGHGAGSLGPFSRPAQAHKPCRWSVIASPASGPRVLGPRSWVQGRGAGLQRQEMGGAWNVGPVAAGLGVQLAGRPVGLFCLALVGVAALVPGLAVPCLAGDPSFPRLLQAKKQPGFRSRVAALFDHLHATHSSHVPVSHPRPPKGCGRRPVVQSLAPLLSKHNGMGSVQPCLHANTAAVQGLGGGRRGRVWSGCSRDILVLVQAPRPLAPARRANHKCLPVSSGREKKPRVCWKRSRRSRVRVVDLTVCVNYSSTFPTVWPVALPLSPVSLCWLRVAIHSG